MKKSLLLLALSSSSAMAVTGGEELDWRNDFTNMTTMNCTGTIVGGKYLLTAGHCWGAPNVGFSDSDGTIKDAITVLAHHIPEDDGTNMFSPDIAVWELERAHDTRHIRYVADLNHDPIRVGDYVTMYGFAGSDQLKKGVSQIADTSDSPHDLSYLYEANNIGQGFLQEGDSGGPWTNADGDIIGVSRSIAPDGTFMMATRLAPVKDWLSQTINAWHYPTLAYVNNGPKPITIQSLHSDVAGIDVANNIHTTGDVTIVREQSTCLTKAKVLPFEKCTLVVDSNGGEGTIELSSGEFIKINKPEPVKPTPPPPSGGDSGGGSFGLFSIMALLGFGIRRRLMR